ncbi:hypothetical protein Droror1_Dr00015059 [Drosera rotundifolia]
MEKEAHSEEAVWWPRGIEWGEFLLLVRVHEDVDAHPFLGVRVHEGGDAHPYLGAKVRGLERTPRRPLRLMQLDPSLQASLRQSGK